eukprot:GHVU01230956.1.p1 GENE.GHVU01230956.1~~GHVU01230956.1.p1  ORF type:complete len:559 (+),score=29.04 GHVU01230956.1:750-2426(+)
MSKAVEWSGAAGHVEDFDKLITGDMTPENYVISMLIYVIPVFLAVLVVILYFALFAPQCCCRCCRRCCCPCCCREKIRQLGTCGGVCFTITFSVLAVGVIVTGVIAVIYTFEGAEGASLATCSFMTIFNETVNGSPAGVQENQTFAGIKGLQDELNDMYQATDTNGTGGVMGKIRASFTTYTDAIVVDTTSMGTSFRTVGNLTGRQANSHPGYGHQCEICNFISVLPPTNISGGVQTVQAKIDEYMGYIEQVLDSVRPYLIQAWDAIHDVEQDAIYPLLTNVSEFGGKVDTALQYATWSFASIPLGAIAITLASLCWVLCRTMSCCKNRVAMGCGAPCIYMNLFLCLGMIMFFVGGLLYIVFVLVGQACYWSELRLFGEDANMTETLGAMGLTLDQSKVVEACLGYHGSGDMLAAVGVNVPEIIGDLKGFLQDLSVALHPGNWLDISIVYLPLQVAFQLSHLYQINTSDANHGYPSARLDTWSEVLQSGVQPYDYNITDEYVKMALGLPPGSAPRLVYGLKTIESMIPPFKIEAVSRTYIHIYMVDYRFRLSTKRRRL